MPERITFSCDCQLECTFLLPVLSQLRVALSQLEGGTARATEMDIPTLQISERLVSHPGQHVRKIKRNC